MFNLAVAFFMCGTYMLEKAREKLKEKEGNGENPSAQDKVLNALYKLTGRERVQKGV